MPEAGTERAAALGRSAARALALALRRARERNPAVFWGGLAGLAGLAIELLARLVGWL